MSKIPKCICGEEIQDSGDTPDQYQGQVNQNYRIDIFYMCMKCGRIYETEIPFSKFSVTEGEGG